MNSQFNQGPLQKMLVLFGKLNNYIYQVNLIISEMSNLLNQMINPLTNPMNNPNPMNFNFNPMFNDNMNLNLNQFMMNYDNIKDYKPKINAVFDVSGCDYEIRKFGNSKGVINISIEPDKSINDLLIEFFKRIEKGNKIIEIKDKFIFTYSCNKLDFNNKKKIKDFLNINVNFQGIQYFNIYVSQI